MISPTRFPAVVGLTLALAGTGAASAGMVEFEFDAGQFHAPTTVTSDYWGLRLAGPTSAVYFSESEDGCEVGQSVVTGTTGSGFFADDYDIDAVVVHDREWVSAECDGEYVLVEDTDDWYAQDDAGNVWYMGEDTTAFDDEGSCLTTTGSWKAGEDGAEPGVIMPADPQPGMAYRQEYYEGEAEDLARVLRLNAAVSVGYGDFSGCLQSKEYTPLSPGEVEHKFYCRLSQGGVGLTLVNELKGRTKRVEYVGDSLDALDGDFPEDFPTGDTCGD